MADGPLDLGTNSFAAKLQYALIIISDVHKKKY